MRKCSKLLIVSILLTYLESRHLFSTQIWFSRSQKGEKETKNNPPTAHSILSVLIFEPPIELSKVHSWLCANKLSLNIDESNFVVSPQSKKSLLKSVIVFINNQSLTEENSISYLGIYIDSNVNWKSHIYYNAKKV